MTEHLSISARKLPVQFADRKPAGCDGLLSIGEMMTPHPLAISVDAGLPSATVWSKADARESARIVLVALLVVHVLRTSRLAQIVESIITAIAVAVIDFVHRPFPGDMQPCEPVASVEFGIDANLKISIGRNAASGFPRKFAVPWLSNIGAPSPSKNACRWIVVQHRANEPRRQVIPLFHVIPRWTVGQTVPWFDTAINVTGD